MKRYLTAIFISFLFLAPMGICAFYRAFTVPRLGLVTIWAIATLCLSLPCNAFADFIRRRLNWHVWTILCIVLLFALIVGWIGSMSDSLKRLPNPAFGEHGPPQPVAPSTGMIWAATLPLSFILMAVYRLRPLPEPENTPRHDQATPPRPWHSIRLYFLCVLFSGAVWLPLGLIEIFGQMLLGRNSADGASIYYLFYVPLVTAPLKVLTSFGSFILCFSLPCNALADYLRRRCQLSSPAILLFTSLIILVLATVYGCFINVWMKTSAPFPLKEVILYSGARWFIGLLPLSLALMASYRLYPLKNGSKMITDPR